MATGRRIWHSHKPGSSSKDAVVLRMRADPEPDAIAVVVTRERTMSEPDPNRPEMASSLKVQRGVARIGLQDRKVLIGEPLNAFR